MMKQLIKAILSPVRKVIQYLIQPELNIDYWRLSPYKTSLVLLYQERMMESSLEYALRNFRNCLHFYNRNDLWDLTTNRIASSDSNGLLLEFGTWKGQSINYFSSRLPSEKFIGFDSFEGLKEDWAGYGYGKGHFNLHGVLPKVNKNVDLVKGWFDETLPGFLATNTQKLKFLHVDCDTYESTATILTLLTDRITPGTLILFDEYIGYASWEIGEYKAFQEFISRTRLKYEYLGFSNQSVLLTVV